MFHLVMGKCEGYIATYHTYKEAVKGAQQLVEIYNNDLHRIVEVHVVDNWDRIVW